MKKSLVKKITLSVLAGSVLMSSGVVWAANPELKLVPGDAEQKSFEGAYTQFETDKSDSSKSAYDWYLSTSPSTIRHKTSTSGNTLTFDVENADVTEKIWGGYSDSQDVKNNTVNIFSGRYEGDINGGFHHGSNGNVTNNAVNISGGAFSGTLRGGYSYNANANNNELNISAGTFTDGTSTGSNICGGEGTNANNNTVNISGGNFNVGRILGGNGNQQSEGNTINITGGTFNASIFGGTNGAKNNTINIIGNAPNLTGAKLSGYSMSGTTGNILNIDGWNGTVKKIENFNAINFKNQTWEKDRIIVMVNSSVSYEGRVYLLDNKGTQITVGDMKRSGGTVPQVSDEMTLLAPVNAYSGTNDAPKSKSSFKIGSFVRAKGEIYKDSDNKNINIKLISVSANEQILALGESRAAATAFTNQGSELIETGLDALARDNEKNTKVFAALYGNASDYETGSYVKVNGFNGIVGVGKTKDNGVTMGAFFENGEGNYRTFNNYEGEMMRGDGEATYNGGGFLYRKDNASGVYTEASLRAGNLQNELRNVAIAADQLSGYDIDTFYYGAHIGVGKIIPRGTEGDNIDIYGKLIYTHYDDEDFKIDGDNFHMDSVESERLRLGFRINEVQDNKLTMYYGAAWEYEFGGDSDNTVEGYVVDVNSPSLGGGTVIGEVGMHYNASEKWSFDINGRAYGGQRDGWSGSIQANYMF